MTTQVFPAKYTYTANITAYDATTKIVTLELDKPVNISMGYNQQFGDITSLYSIRGTATSIANAINAGGAPKLSTDEGGNFVGIFNIPSTKFQTGSRVFRIDNRTVLGDQTTATTYAEATFTASGLATNSQQLNFGASVDSSGTTFTQVSQTPQQLVSTITTYSPYDPVAQSFLVDPANYPNGVFLNSIKLFFATKPTTNMPITVSIVPTVNGYPKGKALDYSTVTLQANQVVTSSSPYYLDSSTYTEFMFNAPVYIQSGVLYAILIKASSPDYTLYYAEQGKVVSPTSTAKSSASASAPSQANAPKIGQAPYVGALFESQNSITWTADQTKDLMFVIDRCVFKTGSATVPFVIPQGAPARKLGHNDVRYKIDPTIMNNTLGNFGTYQYLDALNVSTTDFTPTDTSITYAYQSTLASTNAATALTPITPASKGTAMPENVYLNDGLGERVINPALSNTFTLQATLQSADANVSPIISDDAVSLFAVKYIINNMGIGNNVISVANTGYGYNVQTASISISSPDVPGSNSATLGYTANANGAITSVYVITPGSGYLTSPTITIYDPTTRSGNANASIIVRGETGSSGGNSWAKYFTKKVVLAPGNDAGDLRVYLNAYQPLGSGIYVYYKILSSQDGGAKFESGNWQLMTCTNNYNTYSTDRTNVIEYEYAPGVFNTHQANNYISYTNASGQTFSTFIQFAIKVVMATNDKTNVPYVSALKALALPQGTGL